MVQVARTLDEREQWAYEALRSLGGAARWIDIMRRLTERRWGGLGERAYSRKMARGTLTKHLLSAQDAGLVHRELSKEYPRGRWVLGAASRLSDAVRFAWAEGTLQKLKAADRRLTDEEYERFMRASRWLEELNDMYPGRHPGLEILRRMPVKRSRPRWERDESLRRRYRKLVDRGLDPEEAEAAVKSIGVVGHVGVSSEVAEAVLRSFGVERSPLGEGPQRAGRAQDHSSEATWP